MPKKNNMKGGKFIANGAYGCVYGPNLPGAKHKRQDRYISKIVEKDSALEEFDKVLGLGISTIDPEAKYMVYPLDMDTIIDYDLDNENNFIKCNLVDRHIKPSISLEEQLEILNKHFVNIIQPNGGVSLERLLKSKLSLNKSGYSKEFFDSILVKMINLFKSVSLLNINNICHRDVKIENITTEPTFRLIDFGLSTKELDFNSQTHKQHSNFIYPIWPVDYHILLMSKSIFKQINKYSDTELLEFSNEMYKKIAESTINTSMPTKVADIVNTNIPMDLVAFIKEFISVTKNNDNDQMDSFNNRCILGIDVYSSALVLMDITLLLEKIARKLFGKSSIDFKNYMTLLSSINVLGVEMLKGNPLKRIPMDYATELYLEILLNHGVISKNQYNKEMAELNYIVNKQVAP